MILISTSNNWDKVTPNFIYNRVDLYSPQNAELLAIKEVGGNIIYVPIEKNKHYVVIASWGMTISYKIIEEISKYIFSKYENIYSCIIRRAVVPDYIGKQKCIKNDIYINLPDDENELDARLSTKGRYNIKREKRIATDKFGECLLKDVSIKTNREKVLNLTKKFFEFKKKTYEADYLMSEEEYIEKYYVSNVYYMMFGNNIASIIMSCEQTDNVYLENLTYDPNYAKYSPGQIAYDSYLRNLINKKKKTVFLLGGDYSYKKRYGSIERKVVEYCIHKHNLSAFIYLKSRELKLKVISKLPTSIVRLMKRMLRK